MEDTYTFKQAIIMALVAIIPAILAAVEARSASDEANQAKIETEKMYKNSQVRQSRMDERDLILASINKSTVLIPIENDNVWRLYLKCRDDGKSRVVCTNENKEAILQGLTSPSVATPLK